MLILSSTGTVNIPVRREANAQLCPPPYTHTLPLSQQHRCHALNYSYPNDKVATRPTGVAYATFGAKQRLHTSTAFSIPHSVIIPYLKNDIAFTMRVLHTPFRTVCYIF